MGKYNKYDFIIILFIASLVFGLLGGSLQPIRIITLIFFPFLVSNFKRGILISKNLSKVFIFFTIWYVYSIISLLITSNLEEGVKELFYYFCHFSLFFLIILFSKRAKHPLRSIIYGWLLFFILTSPIALNEIINDQHLSISFIESNSYMNLGDGMRVQKKFASVTFGNYNGYVLMLCFIMPFSLISILLSKKLNTLLVNIGLFLLLSFFILTNASRGGIICLLISTILFFYYYRKMQIKSKSVIFLFIVLLSGIIIYNYSGILLSQIDSRLLAGRGFFEDNARVNIYTLMWNLLRENWFVGTGIGSMTASLSQVTTGIAIGHNMFLEVLMQFGILIFALFCWFLLTIFINGYKNKYWVSKFIIYVSFACLPFSSLINSGYLLVPALWIFFASLYIFSFYEKEII